VSGNSDLTKQFTKLQLQQQVTEVQQPISDTDEEFDDDYDDHTTSQGNFCSEIGTSNSHD
jgi:hypothetical protein